MSWKSIEALNGARGKVRWKSNSAPPLVFSKMADPRIGKERHHIKHAIFVKSLDDVADHLARYRFELS
jgi:hypothetical protein